VLSPNQFSHLSDEEFIIGHLGVSSSPSDLSAGAIGDFADSLPDDVVDWVERGAVTTVKDQANVSATARDCRRTRRVATYAAWLGWQ
jgi:hypothetical protein